MKIRKNQKGIAHHLLLAGIAVLVLGAVGFAGFRVYKSKNDVKAKAFGWTIQSGSSDTILKACRIKIDNAYGKFWEFRFQSYNKSGRYTSSSYAKTLHQGKLFGEAYTTLAASKGIYSPVKKVLAFRNQGDTFSWQHTEGLIQSIDKMRSFNGLSNNVDTMIIETCGTGASPTGGI